MTGFRFTRAEWLSINARMKEDYLELVRQRRANAKELALAQRWASVAASAADAPLRGDTPASEPAPAVDPASLQGRGAVLRRKLRLLHVARSVLRGRLLGEVEASPREALGPGPLKAILAPYLGDAVLAGALSESACGGGRAATLLRGDAAVTIETPPVP